MGLGKVQIAIINYFKHYCAEGAVWCKQLLELLLTWLRDSYIGASYDTFKYSTSSVLALCVNDFINN